MQLEAEHGASASFPRGPPRQPKPKSWLNVVFDLNGILCKCEDYQTRPAFVRVGNEKSPHSCTIPARVGPKLVWVRPGCKAFLEAVSKFGTISVWSSMRHSTTKSVVQYLFRSVPAPKITYGQEQCRRVPLSVSDGVTQYLKVKGTDKDVFLKILSSGLFTKPSTVFTKDNTIVVDDSPYKHVLNSPENLVLADTWTYEGDGASDTFLLNVLLPWLQRLHLCPGMDLKSFRLQNPLGRPAMSSNPYDLEYIQLMTAIQTSGQRL